MEAVIGLLIAANHTVANTGGVTWVQLIVAFIGGGGLLALIRYIYTMGSDKDVQITSAVQGAVNAQAEVIKDLSKEVDRLRGNNDDLEIRMLNMLKKIRTLEDEVIRSELEREKLKKEIAELRQQLEDAIFENKSQKYPEADSSNPEESGHA